MRFFLLCAFAAFSAFAAPAFAQDQQAPRAGDGWYYLDEAPRVAPLPPCGRMPRDAIYQPMFRLERGAYVECRWSYAGPRESRFSVAARCAFTTGYHDDCVAYGRGYSYGQSASYRYGPGGYVPTLPPGTADRAPRQRERPMLGGGYVAPLPPGTADLAPRAREGRTTRGGYVPPLR